MGEMRLVVPRAVTIGRQVAGGPDSGAGDTGDSDDIQA